MESSSDLEAIPSAYADDAIAGVIEPTGSRHANAMMPHFNTYGGASTLCATCIQGGYHIFYLELIEQPYCSQSN